MSGKWKSENISFLFALWISPLEQQDPWVIQGRFSVFAPIVIAVSTLVEPFIETRRCTIFQCSQREKHKNKYEPGNLVQMRIINGEYRYTIFKTISIFSTQMNHEFINDMFTNWSSMCCEACKYIRHAPKTHRLKRRSDGRNMRRKLEVSSVRLWFPLLSCTRNARRHKP